MIVEIIVDHGPWRGLRHDAPVARPHAEDEVPGVEEDIGDLTRLRARWTPDFADGLGLMVGEGLDRKIPVEKEVAAFAHVDGSIASRIASDRHPEVAQAT